ncbi:MAG: hypothetical protein ACI9VR_003687, partial [Cognaticolwellia sp.]
DSGQASCTGKQTCANEAGECADEQLASVTTGICLDLCDAEHPCAQGECLPWQGAQLCQ